MCIRDSIDIDELIPISFRNHFYASTGRTRKYPDVYKRQFLIYTAFVIVSIVWAGYYSFFDWSGVGEKVFVGFKNYIELRCV